MLDDSGHSSLRAEHDALANKLEARVSVEALRRAAVRGFLGVISFGLSWGLLWDRYGERPTETALAHTTLYRAGFLVTFATAVALFSLGLVSFLRGRRLAREEDRLFARLRELRRALGIDP